MKCILAPRFGRSCVVATCLMPAVVATNLLGATVDLAQQAYIKASNTRAGQELRPVSLSGDTLAVASYYEASDATGVNGDQSNTNAPNSGAVYVFVRNGTNLTQQAYLKASNTRADAYFGISVGLSSNTLVVGSLDGAAYVFARNGTNWTQQAYLTPSDMAGSFGNSVSVSGDTIVVGALQDDAAYVFVRNGTNWTEQAILTAANGDPGDYFGRPVRISGDTIVVGAFFEASNATGVNGDETDNSAPDAGAVYVFVRNGTTWTQQAYLKASNTEEDDKFGSDVSVWGDTIVVGAYYEDSSATGVNGNQNDNSAPDSGAAYVFVRNGTTWTQQAYLKASNAQTGDNFGVCVVSSNTIVIGSIGEDSNAMGLNGDQTNNGAADSGAVYVFTRSGSTWTQQAYLKASNTDAGDLFGERLALSGDTLVVVAPREDSSATGVNGNQNDNSALNAGAVYVFTGFAGGNGGGGGGCPTITLSPTSLPDAMVGALYKQIITASGGTAPRTFAVSTGTLPNGLTLSSTGTLTGTPSVMGVSGFTITATDANTCAGSQDYTLTINDAPPVSHDLAIVKLKAPKRIVFKSGVTSMTGNFTVTIQNNGAQNEVIPSFAVLQELVTVSVQSLSNCPNFTATMTLPKKTFPLTLAPKAKLSLAFTGTFNCVNDALPSSKTEAHPDYRTMAAVDLGALGEEDTTSANDDCPRPPSGSDPGCGNKTPAGTLGADVLTDVVVK